MAVRVGRRRGSVDEGLRRRRRRPLLVRRRGVRVMGRVMGRVVAQAARTTQQKAPVARRRRHVMVMVLVHGPEGFARPRRCEMRDDVVRNDETRGKEGRAKDGKYGKTALLRAPRNGVRRTGGRRRMNRY